MADEVAKRIYAQIMNYWKGSGLQPNVVYLGYDTYSNLKQESEYVKQYNHYEKPAKIFGMEIMEVNELNYLAVGYVHKEVKLDD